MTLRLNYDEYGNHKRDQNNRNNCKKSMLAAALVAAGVLFASTPAQATIVDLIHGDSGSINGAIYEYTAP